MANTPNPYRPFWRYFWFLSPLMVAFLFPVFLMAGAITGMHDGYRYWWANTKDVIRLFQSRGRG